VCCGGRGVGVGGVMRALRMAMAALPPSPAGGSARACAAQERPACVVWGWGAGGVGVVWGRQRGFDCTGQTARPTARPQADTPASLRGRARTAARPRAPAALAVLAVRLHPPHNLRVGNDRGAEGVGVSGPKLTSSGDNCRSGQWAMAQLGASEQNRSPGQMT
jgi:hypothetical protein